MVNKGKIPAFKEQLPSVLHPFLNLTVDQAHGDPASYKPLLALIMLMRLKYEGTEKLPYREVRHVLPMVLAELNNPKKPEVAANPFWLLQNDGVWEVRNSDGNPIEEQEVTILKGGSKKGLRPSDSKLRTANPLGSFPDEVLRLLNKAPELIDTVAKAIIDVFLGKIVKTEDTKKRLHQAIGFYETLGTAHLQFSKNVYRAYRSQCSVSQHSSRMFNRLVDIHATPLRPDAVQNRNSASSGIALCGKYDLLFRCGAITLCKQDEGGYAVQTTKYRPKNHKSQPGIIAYRLDLRDLSRLDGKQLLMPEDSEDHPDSALLNWHRENVFLS